MTYQLVFLQIVVKKICRIKNVSYLCSPEINSGSSLKFAFGEYKADKGGEKEFTFVND